jgi:imidazolonepropionase
VSLRIDNIGQLVTPPPSDVPLAGEAMEAVEVITHTSLFIEDGMIRSIGGAEGASTVIDARGGVVTPGLVDAHSHVPFLGTRAREIETRVVGRESYLAQMSSGGGLYETVEQVRVASPEDLLRSTCRDLDRVVSSGTTTLEAKSGYGLERDVEVKQLEVLRRASESHAVRVVPTFLGAHAVPRDVSRDTYVHDLLERQIPEVAGLGLARFVDVFVDPEHGFDHDQAVALLRRGRELGLPGRVHADEFSFVGAIGVAIEAEARTADHLIHAPVDRVAEFAAQGGMPVLLPACSLLLNLGFAPARTYVDRQIPFALGTDYNPGSCPTWSMQAVLGLAVACFRLSAAEALTAATINAAHTLDLGSQTGVIAPGYRADVVLWEAGDYREIPLRLGAPVVRAVISQGETAWSR